MIIIIVNFLSVKSRLFFALFVIYCHVAVAANFYCFLLFVFFLFINLRFITQSPTQKCCQVESTKTVLDTLAILMPAFKIFARFAHFGHTPTHDIYFFCVHYPWKMIKNIINFLFIFLCRIVQKI